MTRFRDKSVFVTPRDAAVRRKAMRVWVIAALSLSVGGCASIVRGTDEPVAFQSDPPGASVATSTGLGCPATPCVIAVPRKDAFVATFAKPGYAPGAVAVATKLSTGGAAGFAGNVLVGGVIGVGVDAYNGASLDHEPNPVVAELKPLGSGAPKRLGPRRRAPAPTEGM